MSRGIVISIAGLYDYNPDIFTGFTVPEGLDRNTVIDKIIIDCGGLELLYPSYTFMKMAIKNWTDTEMPIWEKLYETEVLEYNPLWNVDADITETRTGTGIGSTKGYNEPDKWLDSAKQTNDDTIKTRRTGNIGVTSSQQLLREQRDVADFSTIKFIAESFKKRFCIMLY